MFMIINIVLIFIIYNLNTVIDTKLFKVFNHFEVHLSMVLLDLIYLVYIYFNSKRIGLKHTTFDLKKINIISVVIMILKKMLEQVQTYLTLNILEKESHHILSIV